jgi:hypothetical protein
MGGQPHHDRGHCADDGLISPPPPRHAGHGRSAARSGGLRTGLHVLRRPGILQLSLLSGSNGVARRRACADTESCSALSVNTTLGFQSLSPPKESVEIQSHDRKKMPNENRPLRHPTKSPKVNRFGEYRPGENEYRQYRQRRNGELHRYNPRKQQEISTLRPSGERVVCREVGGATETAVQPSLGDK